MRLTNGKSRITVQAMQRSSHDSRVPTELKVKLAVRLVAGESISAVSRETGIPRQQLSIWRRRFIAGGEHYLESRPNPQATETLRAARDELSCNVAELMMENHLLSRRVAFLNEARSGHLFSHPYCSEAYSRALDEANASTLAVPDWGTHVLVREGPGGKRMAVGARPFASLDPGCDLEAGLDHLRQAGVTSVSLVTDPLWGAERAELARAFDVCRRFKEIYLVDTASEPRISKRHRNRIKNARKAAEVREISLAEHLERWFALYSRNVANRKIPQPFTNAHFEHISRLPGLRTVAVLIDGEIATITMWLPYQDTLYFHDAASSEAGHATEASYVAFAHVVEHFDDCRYIFLGGAADFFDDPLDGLARFKRGFANGSNTSYLCSSILSPLASTGA